MKNRPSSRKYYVTVAFGRKRRDRLQPKSPGRFCRKAKIYTSAFKSLFVNNKERKNKPAMENMATPALITLWKDKIEFVRDSLNDPDYFKEE